MKINLHQHTSKIALALRETTCTQPFGDQCDVYKVFDKVFLMNFHLEDQQVFNVKIEPERGDMLRDFYPFIHKGYHMNKKHWISVYADESMTTDLIQDLVQSSDDLVVSKLNKTYKQRIELLK